VKDRYNVLFLCTRNSARSIMAEAIMNRKGFPTFTAYSAGSHPKGDVHPAALRQIELAKLSSAALRSKGWSEFAAPGAPRLDFVITVCDNARESCPLFFGAAKRLHHNFDDPSALNGSEEERTVLFRRVRDELRAYLRDFARSEAGT